MYRFHDPRPEMTHDTKYWTKLLKLIHTLDSKITAEILQNRLWSLRNGGAMLNLYRDGLKFELVIDERSAWDTPEEFAEMKKQHLAPYASEIKLLLGKVTDE